MQKFEEIKQKIGKVPSHAWILTIIILIGIFLRSYHFHDWLEFREDQVRDAYLSGSVAENKNAWPLLGPKMNYTGDTDQASFHLGPIYYYFQIISAKLFGSYPDKVAYPDLFFAICSIPLLYLFLKNLFDKKLSLALTGLFSISGYFVHYSRFAWNTNLIPFFVLLLLISLFRFLEEKDKVSWKWATALGVATGVGFQLHAILMLLFTSVTFVVFFYTMKNKPAIWKKWILVILVFTFLNTPQIVSELRNNFSNTRALFSFTPKNDPNNVELTKLNLLENDLSCHTEANFLYLSYYGGTDCSYNITKLFGWNNFQEVIKDKFYFFVWILGIIFSGFCYWLLFQETKKKSDKKVIYMRLLFIYCVLFFLVMVPLSSQQFSDLRYFMPVFFVPFVFLGLLASFLKHKFPKQFIYIFASLMLFFLVLNLNEMISEIAGFASNEKTCTSHTITLGEIEPVALYLASEAKGNEVYFGGDKTLPVIYNPVSYLLSKQNVSSVDIGVRSSYASDKLKPEKINGKRGYYLSCKSAMKDKYSFKKIGSIYIFNVSSK